MSKELPQNYELLSGANLAYIGDAYYELQIRKYLLECKITKRKEHKNISVKYVSAHAHHIICEKIKDQFTEHETEIFKRGRNGAHHNYRKNLNYAEYNDSTGFEAIIGYLFLKQDFERLNEIICLSIKAIEESEQ